MSVVSGEHDRMICNLLRVGKIAQLQANPPRVKVTIGDLTTDWLPWFTGAAGTMRTWQAPSVGTQVMVLAPSGELAQAAVLPAIYQDAYGAPSTDPNAVNVTMPDGTVISYNNTSHALAVTIGSTTITADQDSIELAAGGSTLTINAAGITLNGATINLN